MRLIHDYATALAERNPVGFSYERTSFESINTLNYEYKGLLNFELIICIYDWCFDSVIQNEDRLWSRYNIHNPNGLGLMIRSLVFDECDIELILAFSDFDDYAIERILWVDCLIMQWAVCIMISNRLILMMFES